MANVPGPQPDIKYCPVCKSDLVNIPRHRMKSKGYVRYMSPPVSMVGGGA
jgi:hypothetical protein